MTYLGAAGATYGKLRVINMSPPEECWRCREIKPPMTRINILRDAAGSVPSLFKPLCEGCSEKHFAGMVQAAGS